MLRSGARRATRYFTGDLTSRIVICSMEDVVDENGTMKLQRKAAIDTWARIERTKAGTYSPEGRNILEGRSIFDPLKGQTHLIIIRARHDVDFSTRAWIYEARLQSSPRWYKIINWVEDADFNMFEVKLVERSDVASKPAVTTMTPESCQDVNSVTRMTPLPAGVVL